MLCAPYMRRPFNAVANGTQNSPGCLQDRANSIEGGELLASLKIVHFFSSGVGSNFVRATRIPGQKTKLRNLGWYIQAMRCGVAWRAVGKQVIRGDGVSMVWIAPCGCRSHFHSCHKRYVFTNGLLHCGCSTTDHFWRGMRLKFAKCYFLTHRSGRAARATRLKI